MTSREDQPVTRWWWVRHAPVEWAGKRIYGQEDLDADVSNTDSFAFIADRLPQGAVTICSNLTRTHQTLDAIKQGGAAHLPTPHVDADLAEQSFGHWEGRTWNELEAENDPHLKEFWTNPYYNAPPGGESFHTMAARAGQAIERLSETHAGRDIVCVAHAGTIRAALVLAMGLELAPEKTFAFFVDNTTLTRIDKVGDIWRIEGVGISHPKSP